jgi:hypothetical protein
VKDPYRVLREKEQDVEWIRKEIQALRTVIPLFADDRLSLAKIPWGKRAPNLAGSTSNL